MPKKEVFVPGKMANPLEWRYALYEGIKLAATPKGRGDYKDRIPLPTQVERFNRLRTEFNVKLDSIDQSKLV